MIKILGKRYFQQKLEEALLLNDKISEENKPFEFKYQSRNIWKELLEDDLFTMECTNIENFENDKNYYYGILGIIYTYLGKNYFETEENNQIEIHLTKALNYFSKIDDNLIIYFYIYIIEIYNILGYINIYYEKLDTGIGYLDKSKKLIEIINQNKLYLNNSTNIYDIFIIYYNNYKIKNEKNIKFRFFMEGYFNEEKLEDLKLNCYFYLAQIYTSINKSKSAEYCGKTLQIQFKNYEKIDKKEFFNNLIGLTDYFINENKFNMAVYLVLTNLKKLPENKYKKRRGTCHMYLGKIFYSFFKYNLNLILKLDEKNIKEFDLENDRILKPDFILDNNEVEFPKYSFFKEYEASKKYSRISITYSKKASEIYVLNENASTYMNITFLINDNYSLALSQEKDFKRKLLILEKQKENLLLIFKDLNKSYFEEFWLRIVNDLIILYNNFSKIYVDNFKIYMYKINSCNQEGIQYCQILNNYYDNKIKEQPNDTIIITNISNNLIQCGFFYQRMFSTDIKFSSYQLNEGISCFNKSIELLNNPNIILTKNLVESKKLCEEMVVMLKAKLVNLEKSIK